MNHLNYKEKLAMLRDAGFNAAEIRRLQRFYRRYRVNAMDQATPDLQHLRFVRWLVATHRLTDQIDQGGET